MVDDNGKVVLIDGEAYTEQFPAFAQRWAEYGSGKTRLLLEGQIKQARLYTIARSVSLGTGVDLPPIALDPPRLADFLISLIPLKHRENLAGDLEEDYWNRLLPRHGPRKARFLYWVQGIYAVFGFLARPLAGIAGIRWLRRLIEIFIHRIMR